MTDLDQELACFERGAVDLVTREELVAKLERARKAQRPLRIKYGADPSTQDLHLGHTVPLRKLRSLQDLGHTVVFIIGDFTARIGDPSHQSQTRKRLTPEEVAAHAKTYREQVFRILDPARTEVRANSEWLDRLTASELSDLAGRHTVARLLERDDFSKRYKSGVPITVLEFLYPLFQGYDSVAVRADVELGGSDQRFNLLVGRDLQRAWNQEPQVVITLPILEGTDGKMKMSKSYGNDIPIQGDSVDMFGKVMSIPDQLIVPYYRAVTDGTIEQIRQVEEGLQNGTLHPRDAKADLSKWIVRLYYGEQKAEAARAAFDRVFKDHETPQEVPCVRLKRLGQVSVLLVDVLAQADLVKSKSEARRLIEQGGVRVNREVVSDLRREVRVGEALLVQCGKRRFAEILWE